MTKLEYIERLTRALALCPQKQDLIDDVCAHFEDALQNGMSEEDIINQLGLPEDLADDYMRGIGQDEDEAGPATATLGTQHTQFENVRDVILELANCETEIEPSPDGKTYVHVEDVATSMEDRIEVFFDGVTLTLRQRRAFARLLSLFSFKSEKSKVLIMLPKGFAGSVQATNTSGTIKAHDITGGTVHLTTSSGGIKCEKIACTDLSATSASGGVKLNEIKTGNLSATTASGGVKLENASAQSVTLSAASGSVKAQGVTAPQLCCNAASGGIKVTGSACGKASLSSASGSNVFESKQPCAVGARTASGSIDLKLDPAQQMTINARTLSGAVRVGYAATYQQTANRGHKYIVGDGTLEVNCNTASGSIKINPFFE